MSCRILKAVGHMRIRKNLQGHNSSRRKGMTAPLVCNQMLHKKGGSSKSLFRHVNTRGHRRSGGRTNTSTILHQNQSWLRHYFRGIIGNKPEDGPLGSSSISRLLLGFTRLFYRLFICPLRQFRWVVIKNVNNYVELP